MRHKIAIANKLYEANGEGSFWAFVWFQSYCISETLGQQEMLGHVDIKTPLNTYCDVFAEYQQKHTDNVADYLKLNGLLP